LDHSLEELVVRDAWEQSQIFRALKMKCSATICSLLILGAVSCETTTIEGRSGADFSSIQVALNSLRAANALLKALKFRSGLADE
jgi:hypothetical protein